MRLLSRPVLALALVVALALAGGSLVASQTAGAAQGKAKAPASLLRAAADYVGLAPRELLRELRSGKSLAQVAEARGKSREGLRQALLAAVKARLDRALAAGRITSQQHAQLLQRAGTHVDRLLDGTNLRLRRHGKPQLLRVAAQYVGIPPRQVFAELRQGRSLAEIAVAHGKTREGLKQALLNAVSARLDRAVAAGRISATQKAERLARAAARIDRLLDRKRAR